MALHQIVVGASAGDAITGEALLIRQLLRRIGPSEIYARHIAANIADEVLPISELPPPQESGPVMFHLSVGDRDIARALIGNRYRIVLRYHNITPSRYFAAFDPGFGALLELGRELLPALRDRTVLTLADSAYNAGELEQAGFGSVAVVPVLAPWEQLRRTVPDRDTLFHLESTVTGPIVLFVGQLLPHKRPDLLIQAFHLFTTFHFPDAQLVMVGAGRVPDYQQAVVTLVRELNLPNVWLAGAVSDAVLATFFRRADLFATMSEHEGFCVPLVEAMAFDVPVLARDCTAVPETLAGAGVALPLEAGPEMVAEAMVELIGNGRLRADLIDLGRHRQNDFRLDRVQAALLGSLEAVL